MAGIQRVQQEYGRVDGVTTFCEMAVPLVCRLGEMYNLPTNPFAVRSYRDSSFKASKLLPSVRSYRAIELYIELLRMVCVFICSECV